MLAELLENVEILSFDVGFTLLEPAGSFGGILASIAARYGFKFEAETLNERFLTAHHRYLAEAKAQCGKGIYSCDERSRYWWEAMARDAFDHKLDEPLRRKVASESYEVMALADSWRIYPDVIPSLEELKRSGYRMIVISNWDNRLEVLLDAIGLRKYFERLYISSHIGFEKPQPEIFKYVLNDLRVSPESILHIGDNPVDDVQGPALVGIKGLRIIRPNKIAANLPETGGMNSLRELLDAMP